MSRTVLSINGNKPMNFMLQTVLSRKYKFQLANDVYQGMQFLNRSQNTALIVVDVDVNCDDCWEFIHHIKSSGIYNHPVIVLTSDGPAARNAMGNANVAYIFQKPFSPIDLIKTIEVLLEPKSILST